MFHADGVQEGVPPVPAAATDIQTPGYLQGLQGASPPPVLTRLVVAAQRLTIALSLNDRLGSAAPQTNADLLSLVTAALPPPAVECVFSGFADQQRGSFDCCGALHHIATQGGTVPWQLPTTVDRAVKVVWSSVFRRYGGGPSSNLVSGPAREGFEGHAAVTTNETRACMAVDLGEDRKMLVTGYALRNGGWGGCALRSWELQGSTAADGPWHTLDQRENDETLAKYPDDGVMHYDAGYWSVQANDCAVRHVRIVQIAANANGNRHLSCGGVELYGALQER